MKCAIIAPEAVRHKVKHTEIILQETQLFLSQPIVLRCLELGVANMRR